MSNKSSVQDEQEASFWYVLRYILGTVSTIALAVVGYIAIDVKSSIAVMQVEQRTVVEALVDIKEALQLADGRIETEVRRLALDTKQRLDLLESRLHELETEK